MKSHFVNNLMQTHIMQMYLHNYFTIAATSITFDVDLGVVEFLIAQTIFDSKTENYTIGHFVAPFTPCLVTKEGEPFIASYFVIVKNLLQFYLSLDMLAAGLSFC